MFAKSTHYRRYTNINLKLSLKITYIISLILESLIFLLFLWMNARSCWVWRCELCLALYQSGMKTLSSNVRANTSYLLFLSFFPPFAVQSSPELLIVSEPQKYFLCKSKLSTLVSSAKKIVRKFESTVVVKLDLQHSLKDQF